MTDLEVTKVDTHMDNKGWLERDNADDNAV